MKRTVLQLVVVLSFVGSIRADQTIQSVQQALTDQGFYYGNVTGEKSAETTAAIRRYQIRNGLQVNGEINSETLRSLNVNSNSASSPRIPSISAVAQPTPSHPEYNSRAGLDSSPRSFGESRQRVETSRALVGVNESAPWRYESRVWVHKKIKHGKWKVKWRKHHWRDDGDEYADEDERGNGNGRWHGHDHGDDD